MKAKLAKPQPTLDDQKFADQVIAECQDRTGALLTILEKVQEHNPNKYLPLEILEYVADKTDTPLSQIYGVATFYALFNPSRREITLSAYVGEPPATRAGHATSWSASNSNSACKTTAKRRR